MKKRKPVRKDRSFSPDAIATRVHQAYLRDLQALKLSHKCPESVVNYVLEQSEKKFLKKYFDPDSDQKSLVTETYNKFLGVNEHMGTFRVPIKVPVRHPRSTNDYHEKVLLRARALAHFVLGSVELDEVFLACKHGPGTSQGVSFEDTSPEAKFKYPISVTSDAKPLFESYLTWDKQLQVAIEKFNSFRITNKYDIVSGSRATTVPKNSEIRRMIAIEPTANMFLQQGLMAVLYDRLRVVGLDVSCLPRRHTELAFAGSVTRNLATIDFSSASDCVSLELLRFLIPPKWFRLLDVVRCKTLTINGRVINLNMFSTMGNATTFPVETLVFWVLAHAVKLTEEGSKSLHPEWEDLKTISVFGDDCIVPSHIAEPFIGFCRLVGFLVNDEKSFFGDEPFRESCGGDYLLGFDVRPFYLGCPLSTKRSSLEPWLYTMVNGILKKYISYFGALNYVYDRHVLRVIFALFREHKLKVKFVPPYFPEDSGIHYASDLARLHREYNFTMSPIHISEHGEYRFHFVNFKYRVRLHVDYGIRYALALKTSQKTIDFNPWSVNLRKRGGYVVAKGVSSCWTVQRSS